MVQFYSVANNQQSKFKLKKESKMKKVICLLISLFFCIISVHSAITERSIARNFPTEPPIFCDIPGNPRCPVFTGVGYPHCGRFMMCMGGYHFELDCPGDTIFNDELKVCDIPERTTCVQFKGKVKGKNNLDINFLCNLNLKFNKLS